MSRNLVEIVRRHHEVGAPTALAVLKEARERRAVSLAEPVCLGCCHASPAIRDGDVIDAGAGVVERVLADAAQPAAEPTPRGVLRGGPQLLATGRDWHGLEHALATMTPKQLLAHVTEAELRGHGGASFPAGVKWEFARDAAGERRFIVANADEGDPAISSVS